LFNAAFVIACDLHDLGHPATGAETVNGPRFEASGSAMVGRSGPDRSDPLPAGHAGGASPAEAAAGTHGHAADPASPDWHDVFHVGHGIVQALGLASALSLETLILPVVAPFPRAIDRELPERGSSIHRPPIDA